jgi:hypothetical protein
VGAAGGLVEDWPLAALEQARRMARRADALGERVAAAARERGIGWSEIGEAAGTTTRGTQQRYGRHA